MNTQAKQSFSGILLEGLSPYHLLKHPFYQAWSNGELKKDDLAEYAGQYFHHVDAFPRYISATHSGCPRIEDRQVLLRNLIDEEKGDRNHPELWLRFGEAVGSTRESTKNADLAPETENLLNTFFKLSGKSYAAGLGALFAYENQVPEVAQTKIEGLKKFYGIEHKEALDFFEVHLEADVWHTQETAALMDHLSPTEQEEAREASLEAAQALWKFLDGVEERRQLRLKRG